MGYEVVFDVGRPRDSGGGVADFLLRWPSADGTEYAVGLGAMGDGAPAIVVRELSEDSFEVVDSIVELDCRTRLSNSIVELDCRTRLSNSIVELEHLTLPTGIPARVRFQSRPGYARLKVWPSTSSEPADDWISINRDLRATGELRWAFRASAAPDPPKLQVGSVVVRHLPCADDTTVDNGFPLLHAQGADVGVPLRSC